MLTFEFDPAVIKVNASDFSTGGSLITHPVNSNKRLTLVMFKASWCGHCESLKPAFQQAANELQNVDVNLAVYESTLGNNSTKLHSFTDYKIEGFPTLVLFYDGVFQEVYQNGRNNDSIVKYMITKSTQFRNNPSVFSSSYF